MRKFISIIISSIFIATLIGPSCFAQTTSSLISEHNGKKNQQTTGEHSMTGYKNGKTLYKNKCQFCHGKHGDGKGPAAEPLLGHPVDFTDPEFWKEDVPKKIEVTIKNGKEMMPAFNLEPDQINLITLYISHSFKK
ncbi:MAG: c-type cytochrome [Candidatus Saccharimonadaceae bacterium]